MKDIIDRKGGLVKRHKPFHVIGPGEAYIEIFDISVMGNTSRKKELWRNFLKNWVKVMKKYMAIAVDKNNDPDIPYWYGEDANTSFLAQAAWRSGAVAIEQFDVRRKDSEGCHCDLWIKFKGEDGFDFSAEAKKARKAKPSTLKKEIEDCLKNAGEQLDSIIDEGDRGQFQISLCFAVPESSSQRKDRKFVKSLLKLFTIEERKNLIIVSYFPRKDIKFLMDKDKKTNKKYIYSGVILIARISKRKSR